MPTSKYEKTPLGKDPTAFFALFIYLFLKNLAQIGTCIAERISDATIIATQEIMVPYQPTASASPVKRVFATTTPRDAEALRIPATVAPLPHLLNLAAIYEVVKSDAALISITTRASKIGRAHV